jgi:uncharacterized protein (DUF1501 family)
MMIDRRTLLKGAAAGLGSLNLGGLTAAWARAAAADASGDRILVVFELSGGNDGLNTVVPFSNDAYYRLRPKIGIKPEALLKLDGDWGLNPGLLGFERLWRDGQLAVVHGCGYAQPSFSHFTSMAYWHTASPNSGDEYGWYGRLADAMSSEPRANYLINIDGSQSLAVKSRVHTPVVFNDPERFKRNALVQEKAILDYVDMQLSDNAALDYLNLVARGAREASALVRQAWTDYDSPIDYGVAPSQFRKVAACIAAGLPAQLYYIAFPNNAFDTHVQQPNLHRRLLSYASDAVHGFIRDMERIGQADRVAVLMFSEFGRRAPENSNLGTDHGAANLMLLAGQPVRGGHYGDPPSLVELDDGDNLIHTTDFRRVYATVIDSWLKAGAAETVLKGRFETFPVFDA